MIIANPIYDITFKKVLEDDRAAKFLIGTILDCEVLSLVRNIQEHTYEKSEDRDIALLRMDFAATIRTKEEGEKKVIIELQKALHDGDIERFRRYLGFEYVRSPLPIISIYILGFNLSIESAAFIARPDCWDLQTNKKIDVKESFVQQLTHRAYFVQTLRIKPNYNTRLERLLSVFEQSNFIGDSQTTKALTLIDPDPDLNVIVNILKYIAADENMKNELLKEEYYHQYMEGKFGQKNKEIREKENIIAEKNRKLVENRRKLAEHKKRLTEKNKKLTEHKKQLAEKNQKLAEHKKQLAENKKALAEARQINLDIARKMKQSGMSLAEISQLTKLSIKELEKL